MTSLLHEIRDGMVPLTRSLSAAGFDDIHDDELFVLMALGIENEGLDSILRIAGITGRTADSLVKTMLARGYLEHVADPDEPGKEFIEISERGAAARRVIDKKLRAQRWADFPFRQGDIVISAPPKSGITWVQMICALLIFQTPDLPAPLRELSPWLEIPKNARPGLFAQLAAQKHRRFIKCHMSLDLMTIDPRATYIAVARHPLDALLSFYHQIGSTHPEPKKSRPSPREWLLRLIDEKEAARDPLAGAMRTLSAAWARRDEPNVVLLRYEDLSADLEGQMRGLAARLDITVPEAIWPGLVDAATFGQMRAAADRIQPLSNLGDPSRFFRKGEPGAGRALLTGEELARYDERAARLAPADLLAWLNS